MTLEGGATLNMSKFNILHICNVLPSQPLSSGLFPGTSYSIRTLPAAKVTVVKSPLITLVAGQTNCECVDVSSS